MAVKEPRADQIFEHALRHEMTRSERRRAQVLLSIFGLASVGFSTGYLFLRDYIELMFNGRPPYGLLAMTVGGMIVYSGLMYALLDRYIRKGKTAPTPLKFASAFVETSLPSVILLMLFPVFSPLVALEAVPMYMYFLFITLSGLRFDFRISLFTGVVAAVEYLALAFLAMQSSSPASSLMLDSPLFHAGKAMMLLGTGIITGLVSREIQSRILKSLQAVDERNQVIGLFGQHVSPAVVDRLMALDAPEGEIRPVCVMFLDIRNFTAYSEHHTPQEVLTYLNSLFAPLIEIVNQHHGIVNKFLGDGFLAVFGAPLAEGHPPRNAVRAALAISLYLEQAWLSGDLPHLEVGIGLHGGDAVTGTVGSAQRKEYTIIGDVVNIAARIEQLNKQYNSRLLVSADLWKAADLPDHHAECLGVVAVRGHDAGVEIYKLA